MFIIHRSSRVLRHSSARALATLALGGAAVLCLVAPAGAAEVNAAVLRASFASIDAEGGLCPPGSFVTALSEDGATATVLFSQALGGSQSARCSITFELDVPAGLSLGLPSTAIRGFAQDGAAVTRTYAFQAASGSQQLSETVDQDFVLATAFSDPRSPTCGGSQRATYVIDLTADLLSENTFFQVDSIDVDTSFRFGTSWASCDPADPLTIAPSQAGEFCDGPNQQPCASGLLCDRESAPNNNEGTCFVP
jgi:hypothetical protein